MILIIATRGTEYLEAWVIGTLRSQTIRCYVDELPPEFNPNLVFDDIPGCVDTYRAMTRAYIRQTFWHFIHRLVRVDPFAPLVKRIKSVLAPVIHRTIQQPRWRARRWKSTT